MGYGTVLAHFDVAQIAVYVFWGSFAALIFYLRREDHREGYPLVPDMPGTDAMMFPPPPPAKYFRTNEGHEIAAPRAEASRPVTAAERAQPWAGAPLLPSGDALVDGVGPAAYAIRSETPEVIIEDGGLKLLPLRAAPGYYLAPEDIDPKDMAVVGNDGKVVGHITDVWVDRGEYLLRYFEVGLLAQHGGDRILLPVLAGSLSRKRHELVCDELSAEQIARVPRLAHPEQMTPQEEDRISGYFGGSRLYGKPSRVEPLL